MVPSCGFFAEKYKFIIQLSDRYEKFCNLYLNTFFQIVYNKIGENPMMRQNYSYPYSPYPPVSIPRQRTYINPLNGRRTTSFKTLISGAEKSVDTISSIIPLYKKVKPVLDQGKTMLTSVTSFFSKKPEAKAKSDKRTVEHVEAEVVSEEPAPEKREEKAEEASFDYRKNSSESKPFFI